MKELYNRFSGQSLDRLAALSDGIFAFAMTLLVLGLRVPVSRTIHSERDLLHALGALTPALVTYLMSFLTLGMFWVGQQTQLGRFARSDRDLTWIQMGFLLAVTLMPFSTGLLAEFITYRTALVIYWLNIVLLGAMLFAALRYATRVGILKADTTPEMIGAMNQRIIVAQSLYAFGALLCVVNTYLSIAFIVLVQLNYVVAPRIRPLYRI